MNGSHDDDDDGDGHDMWLCDVFIWCDEMSNDNKQDEYIPWVEFHNGNDSEVEQTNIQRYCIFCDIIIHMTQRT